MIATIGGREPPSTVSAKVCAVMPEIFQLPCCVLVALVFGPSPQDPRMIVYGVTVLGGIALLGSSVPALRAIRVDPMEALRAE